MANKLRRYFQQGMRDNRPQYPTRFRLTQLGADLVDLEPKPGDIGDPNAQPMSGENIQTLETGIEEIDKSLLHVELNYQEWKMTNGRGKILVGTDYGDNINNVTSKTSFISTSATTSNRPTGLVNGAGINMSRDANHGAQLLIDTNTVKTFVRAMFNGVWTTRELANTNDLTDLETKIMNNIQNPDKTWKYLESKGFNNGGNKMLGSLEIQMDNKQVQPVNIVFNQNDGQNRFNRFNVYTSGNGSINDYMGIQVLHRDFSDDTKPGYNNKAHIIAKNFEKSDGSLGTAVEVFSSGAEDANYIMHPRNVMTVRHVYNEAGGLRFSEVGALDFANSVTIYSNPNGLRPDGSVVSLLQNPNNYKFLQISLSAESGTGIPNKEIIINNPKVDGSNYLKKTAFDVGSFETTIDTRFDYEAQLYMSETTFRYVDGVWLLYKYAVVGDNITMTNRGQLRITRIVGYN